MDNSVVYQVYKRLKNIYVESSIVQGFSTFLSSLFNILVNSRFFLTASDAKSRIVFENSSIWKMIKRLFNMGIKLLDRKFIHRTVESSFFVNFITDIADRKRKDAINQITLILIFTFVINMGIKIITGSFLVIGNKILIGLLVGLIGLYLLQLDYKAILGNSKILRTAYEIFYDEQINHDI